MANRISSERLEALLLCDLVYHLVNEIKRLKGSHPYRVGGEELSEMLARIVERNRPKDGECL